MVQLARPVGRRGDPASPDQVALQPEPTRKALDIMGTLGRSKAADPSLPGAARGPGAPGVRDRRRRVPGQLAVHLRQRRDNKAPIFKDIAWAPWPRVDADTPSRRRSAASTGAWAPTRSTRERPSRPPRACATRRTSARWRSRAACRPRSRRSTTTRRSRRPTRSRTRSARSLETARGAPAVAGVLRRVTGHLHDAASAVLRAARRGRQSCATSSSRRSRGRRCCERATTTPAATAAQSRRRRSAASTRASERARSGASG